MPIATLLSLPPEVLYDIHLLSASEHLPLVCKTLFSIYTHGTTTRYRALFLWRKYFEKEIEKPKNRPQWDLVVCNRCCSMEALKILREFYLAESTSQEKQLRISQIPTRLFKALSNVASVRPSSPVERVDELQRSYQYIKLLLSDFHASPDKLGGYPLARSVLSGNIQFIRLLLDYGARPSYKNNLVMMVAIGTGDLKIIRLLVEPNYRHPQELEHDEVACDSCAQAKAPPLICSKKSKLEDRLRITDEMLEKAVKRKDSLMAQYFMERGARPTLDTIRFMENL
ncbi:hypothetical protein O181_012126 [Austropuccinia psidii MF-1]|uniref:Uncharacterized protein n=1 Tax=Austropuccinia psidii MF-1 TaxID=1389203 RepID=A0A9Q3BU25_9BASI|nr:hypothetical protein [Austropuccinia psidii MF-1]